MFTCYCVLCHSDLTGDFEVIKLCDFGVAVPLKANGEIDTEAGSEYVGTVLWSAPEVLRKDGLTPITNKADMFSYGLVLWEMIALCPPHLDESLTDDSSIDTATDDTMERSMVNAYGKNFVWLTVHLQLYLYNKPTQRTVYLHFIELLRLYLFWAHL
jgi:serine/threonine protein kinase